MGNSLGFPKVQKQMKVLVTGGAEATQGPAAEALREGRSVYGEKTFRRPKLIRLTTVAGSSIFGKHHADYRISSTLEIMTIL